MVIDDGLQHSAIPEQNESSDDYNASANKNPANQTISRNDDPEPTRTSEFIRFRTRGGTQILLSESDGMIYMATRNGQNWVELAPDGNIDIYSGAQVSIHSQGSINFVAQTDVNIEAGRNINLKARGGTSEHMSNGKGNIFIEASKNIHTKCGESMYSTIGKEKHVTVAEDYRIQSKFINQKTTDSYVLEVGKDQHINVVQNKIEEIGQTVQLQVAGTYSAEIQGETSFDFASFLSIRAASFSITGIDEGLSMSSTSSGLQIKSPQDIKMQATNVHIKGTPHISSGGDNNPADSAPSSPSFGSVGSPANPVTPTEATPPFVYALGDNAQYGTSIASRAPEHEPWQGHVVGSTSSHAPYTGPNETLAQTKARITAPPAGSAAYEGRATVATTGATAAITSAISSAIGNNRSGSTNPAASNINFDKIEADVKKFVATAVTGIANNVVGMKMSDQGKQYLCSWEYYVPFEYPDGEKNGKQLYSIGYGHSLQGNDSAFTLATMLAGLTEEEAFDLLSNTDIPRYEKDVRKQIKVSVRQHEFDALVDCAYNRGAFNPGLVDAINALNNNNREGVADGLLSSSATGGGDPNLISRRRSNVELFYTGKYNFNVSREELKGTGLRNFTYEQWIGDNLYRKWGRTIFPETTQGNKVLVQAYLAYNRSTDKDKFNLPDTLPLKDTLKPRLQGALKKSLADTLKVKDKLVALKDKLTN
jgi:lysozyme